MRWRRKRRRKTRRWRKERRLDEGSGGCEREEHAQGRNKKKVRRMTRTVLIRYERSKKKRAGDIEGA